MSSTHHFTVPAHIFREYDIRGVIGVDLSDEFAYTLGLAFGQSIQSGGIGPIVVGYDCRPTSLGYAKALIAGLRHVGRDVVDVGMVPTPVLYWSIRHLHGVGGIQITGSHNPADNNGFKMCVGDQPMPASTIQELRQTCDEFSKQGVVRASTEGTLRQLEVLESYIREITAEVKPRLGARKIRVVADAGNGVGALSGVPVLKALGVDVVEMFCDPDGTFPNHHPDPTLPENIQALADAVRKHSADFGIGWDGDGDRIVVLDETGKAFAGDLLLLVMGRAVLAEKPGATIIADVKCSQVLFDDLTKRGARVVMSKSGHSSIKSMLKELKADLAGELSGHICFGDRFYGFDCACYDTARFVEMVSKLKGPVSSLLSDVPEMHSTAEERFESRDDQKFEVVKKAVEKFAQFPCELIDGVRVRLPHGWILVRASNTQPVLVSRVEADTQARLGEYKELLAKTLAEIEAELR